VGSSPTRPTQVTALRGRSGSPPLFADAARPAPARHRRRWFVDETYVKVAGRWRYLYRAVGQYGQVIDVPLREHRDTAARAGSSPGRCGTGRRRSK